MITPAEMLPDDSAKDNPEEMQNIPDETSVTDLPKELLDDTDQNEVVLPEETTSTNNVLPDKTDLVVTPDLPLLKTTNSSTDDFPDTTVSAPTLPEATDTTSGVISNESVMDTTSNLDNNLRTSDQTTTITKNGRDTGELLGTTGDVLPDKMLAVSPKNKLPEATIQDSLPINESTETDLQVNPSEFTVTKLASELAKLTLDPLESTETMNDIKNESDANLIEDEGTNEKIVGEITFTDPENTNNDSKGNLTLDDMPLGVSGMHPLETSSVISEPIDGGVPV